MPPLPTVMIESCKLSANHLPAAMDEFRPPHGIITLGNGNYIIRLQRPAALMCVLHPKSDLTVESSAAFEAVPCSAPGRGVRGYVDNGGSWEFLL